MKPQDIPPDFTDEACYLAYLKATTDAKASNFPSDFPDESCYLAYLKAVASGLVKEHGKDLASEALTVEQRAICASLRINPEDYLATLIAEGKTPLSADPQHGAKPLACPTRHTPMASLAAKPSGCRLEHGKWVDCEGFVGVAVLRSA